MAPRGGVSGGEFGCTVGLQSAWEELTLSSRLSLRTLWWSESEGESHSIMFNSLWSHGLYSPWNSPGQNTGVGSCCLLQGIFPTQGLNPGLPPCRQILYQLSHQGSPRTLWVADNKEIFLAPWTQTSVRIGGRHHVSQVAWLNFLRGGSVWRSIAFPLLVQSSCSYSSRLSSFVSGGSEILPGVSCWASRCGQGNVILW